MYSSIVDADSRKYEMQTRRRSSSREYHHVAMRYQYVFCYQRDNGPLRVFLSSIRFLLSGIPDGL